MKIIVCEAAALNDDGTFSVHRGGIDRFDTSIPPCEIAVVLLIEGDQSEVGTGAVQIHIDVSGAATLQGTALVLFPAVDTPRVPIPVQVLADKVGVITYEVRVGTVPARTRVTVGP